MEISTYYSDSYSEARQKFIQYSSEAGAVLSSEVHPEKGPNGEDLCTDYALFGNPSASKALVLLSGTHGVEGFAGSAIQIAIIKDIQKIIYNTNVKVIIIHGLNPYGMAFARRADHQNIDVNRNYIDFSKTLSPNVPYESLASILAPKNMNLFSDILSWSRMFMYRAVRGNDFAQHALQRGQRSHPQGLFYGGTEQAWSHRVLKKILQVSVGVVQELVVLDIHTGLGKYGTMKLLSGEYNDSEEAKRARRMWGDKQIQCIDPSSDNFKKIQGSTSECIVEAFPKSNNTMVTMEFGTYSPVKIFRALRNENWAHHHGKKESRLYNKMKKQLVDSFYPNDLLWKRDVCRAGCDAIRQALKVLVH